MPSGLQPSMAHFFISLLEFNNKLLRNYTQNIDNLEVEAGVTRCVQSHGTMQWFRCIKCRKKVPRESVEKDVYARLIPPCPDTKCGGIMVSILLTSFF